VTGIARQLLPGTKPRARDPRVDPIPGDVVVVQRRDHKRGTWVETARRVTFSSPWTEPVGLGGPLPGDAPTARRRLPAVLPARVAPVGD
jgi:hypothetical protein